MPAGLSVAETNAPGTKAPTPGRRGRSGMPPDCRMSWQPTDPPHATPRIRRGPDHHHDPRDDDRGHDRPGHLRAMGLGDADAAAQRDTAAPVR